MSTLVNDALTDNNSFLSRDELDVLNLYFPKGVVAIDVETTGLSPLIDKVVELAAIKITGDKIETFSQLINPLIPIPQKTIDIHGISDQMVKDAPTSKEVWPIFLSFAAGLPLIAHNAKFDIGFLVFESHQLKLELPQGEVFCSCQIAKRCIFKVPNHKLSILAKHLDIPLVNHHRAFDDAVACLRIFAKSLLMSDDVLRKKALKDSFLFEISDFQKTKELKNSLNSKEGLPLIELLTPAIEGQKTIQIKYNGGSHKNELRSVRPVALLPLPSGDVLYALCLLSNHHKSFALHKIKEVIY